MQESAPMQDLSHSIRRKCKFLLIIVILAAGVLSTSNAYSQKTKTTIGRVEKITIPALSTSFEARIDTGAHTCSLHVTDEKVVIENGERYLEFDTEDSHGNKFHLKSKIYKESRIKNTSGTVSTRYVIREEVKLGNITKLVNINLNDRSELKYNFLVGRNLLRGDFIVDVSHSHTLGE